MKEIQVTYLLDEEQEARLKKITEACQKRTIKNTEEQQFEVIMTLGCKWDIDDKLSFYEFQLGLRENFISDSWKEDRKRKERYSK